jgi:LuxR family maltose regulon positive regulatory protein
VSSSSTLLATKLLIPMRRPNLVLRPHLIDRLDWGIRAGPTLTIVCASPGCGKTTLVTEWLHNVTHPVAWLSLDEQDNDPARFLAYLIAALRHVSAGVGAASEALLQSPQPLLEMVLTSLINELAAQAPHGKRIVAEQSGHYIQLDQPELVIDAIREVVEAAPRQLTAAVH